MGRFGVGGDPLFRVLTCSLQGGEAGMRSVLQAPAGIVRFPACQRWGRAKAANPPPPLSAAPGSARSGERGSQTKATLNMAEVPLGARPSPPRASGGSPLPPPGRLPHPPFQADLGALPPLPSPVRSRLGARARKGPPSSPLLDLQGPAAKTGRGPVQSLRGRLPPPPPSPPHWGVAAPRASLGPPQPRSLPLKA